MISRTRAALGQNMSSSSLVGGERETERKSERERVRERLEGGKEREREGER